MDEAHGQDTSAVPTQAERIIQKFGGARRLSLILNTLGLKRNTASIYKWTYPRAKGGTGGFIPTSAWPDLLRAARFEGIVISSREMDPRDEPIDTFRGKNVLP